MPGDHSHLISPSFPDQRRSWDEEYTRKGKLWGNAPKEIPGFHTGRIVLDLGSGDGKNLKTLISPDRILIGMDFSFPALRLSRSDPLCRGILHLCGDARRIPLKDETVDTVHIHHLIGHLTKEERGLSGREVHRILKQDGTLLVTVFGEGDMRSGKGMRIEEGTYLRGQGILTHYFTKEEIISLFSDFHLLWIRDESWTIRIRGEDHPRSEITASFQKRS